MARIKEDPEFETIFQDDKPLLNKETLGFDMYDKSKIEVPYSFILVKNQLSGGNIPFSANDMVQLKKLSEYIEGKYPYSSNSRVIISCSCKKLKSNEVGMENTILTSGNLTFNFNKNRPALGTHDKDIDPFNIDFWEQEIGNYFTFMMKMVKEFHFEMKENEITYDSTALREFINREGSLKKTNENIIKFRNKIAEINRSLQEYGSKLDFPIGTDNFETLKEFLDQMIEKGMKYQFPALT